MNVIHVDRKHQRIYNCSTTLDFLNQIVQRNCVSNHIKFLLLQKDITKVEDQFELQVYNGETRRIWDRTFRKKLPTISLWWQDITIWHEPDLDNIKVLWRKDKLLPQKVCEAIFIKKQTGSILNRKSKVNDSLFRNAKILGKTRSGSGKIKLSLADHGFLWNTWFKCECCWTVSKYCWRLKQVSWHLMWGLAHQDMLAARLAQHYACCQPITWTLLSWRQTSKSLSYSVLDFMKFMIIMIWNSSSQE